MSKRSKVVSLNGDEIIPPGEPRPNVIEFCEELLERARSGDVMGLAVAMVHSDGSTSHRHEGRANYALVGSLQGLTHQMVDDIGS